MLRGASGTVSSEPLSKEASMVRVKLLAAALLTMSLLAGCGKSEAPASPAPAAPQSAAPAWPAFVEQFIEAHLAANPAFAAEQGRHEFDGQLPDWSAAGLQKEIARLEQARAAALEYTNESLPQDQRFQRDYFVSVADNLLFWLRDARKPQTNAEYYFDNGLDPSAYVSVPYAPADTRLRAFIKYATGIPQAVEHILANLQTPLPRTFVDYGISGSGGFVEFYRKDVPLAFAEVKDAQLQKELQTVIEPAAQAMEKMRKWFEAQKAQATDAYALGAEKFVAMVRMTEGVTTPIEKLEVMGRADLERNLTALAQACTAYLPKGSLAACVAKQAADKPRGGAVEGARGQLAQLRQFVVDRNIATIPGTEQALVEEAPAYRRQNSAYIMIAGAYETNLPSTYYIAPPDPSWSKAEQEAYIPGKADLLFTSVHEVWPGHFLQSLHSSRAPWRFGQLFTGYAFAEGWAHYAEEMMVQQGLAKDAPELHIGQLSNALLRNVRYMCAIGLHTQGMSVAECEKMFKEKAFQDAGNARQQAARGTYDPAYLNYTMGKLMIMKLRADWQAKNPQKTLKDFHDRFLSYGGPPIPLVRAQMLPDAGGDLF
jgi:uncharacterized protein (DUF885 family)